MLTQMIVWLNAIANALAAFLLAPIAWVPGWLSLTVIAGVTGIIMLVVFKHTSSQQAIKRTRNGLKANLLALSLFKEDMRVGLRCQGRSAMGSCAIGDIVPRADAGHARAHVPDAGATGAVVSVAAFACG